MKNIRYILYCLVILFGLILKANASTEDIYYLEELTTFKTVKNGSKIVVGNHYPSSMSLVYNDGTFDSVNGNSYVLGNGINSNICYSIQSISNNIITFKNDVCRDVEIPNYRNQYSISYHGTYSWYKILESVVVSDGFIENDHSYISNGNGMIRMDFESNKGDILYFQYKDFLPEGSSCMITLDGTPISLDDSYYLYQRAYIEIPSNGSHLLEIVYSGNEESYFDIQKMHVLRSIGNDQQLDLSKVKNKDHIYYEVKDQDVVSEGSFYYIHNEMIDSDPFVGENPKTIDSIYVMVAIFIAVIVSFGYSVYRVNKTKKFISLEEK